MRSLSDHVKMLSHRQFRNVLRGWEKMEDGNQKIVFGRILRKEVQRRDALKRKKGIILIRRIKEGN
jgi:hypothetical protein